MNENSTVDKITRAATAEFSQYGFDGSRIDRIAKKAKINKAMIYYHFKGKEALYEHTLTGIVTAIYERVSPFIPEDASSPEELANLIRGYSAYLGTIDENVIKIIIREIASGGKYFKKITIPILLLPIIKRVTEMFARGQAKGLFKNFDPVYTMMQLVGSIVFFNMLRTTMKDSPLADIIFQENYLERYTENLIKIYTGGIIPNKR